MPEARLQRTRKTFPAEYQFGDGKPQVTQLTTATNADVVKPLSDTCLLITTYPSEAEADRLARIFGYSHTQSLDDID